MSCDVLGYSVHVQRTAYSVQRCLGCACCLGYDVTLAPRPLPCAQCARPRPSPPPRCGTSDLLRRAEQSRAERGRHRTGQAADGRHPTLALPCYPHEACLPACHPAAAACCLLPLLPLLPLLLLPLARTTVLLANNKARALARPWPGLGTARRTRLCKLTSFGVCSPAPASSCRGMRIHRAAPPHRTAAPRPDEDGQETGSTGLFDVRHPSTTTGRWRPRRLR